MVPLWFYIVVISAFGACIGSFLNVVIYRLPRDKSLVSPPSACPGCDKLIAFYDNIPILSWLILGGKCRNCKMKISPQYIMVEFLTAAFFVAFFLLNFVYGDRRFELCGQLGLDAFINGGYVFYIMHITLIACFIAASVIDLKLWIIPLSICWFVTAAGLIGSTIGRVIISSTSGDPLIIGFYQVAPFDSAITAILATGATVGLIIALILLAKGIIKRSYPFEEGQDENEQEINYNHRIEMLKEVVFLLPIIICALLALILYHKIPQFNQFWQNFAQIPAAKGFFASLWGYFIGCAVVWATRILGTLGFGKEAMGLGDVHLMGAAGAVIGPVFVVIAFFVAPFFGLAWAGYQVFFKKTRQIPYGPFLSLGVFAVMIFHDYFRIYISNVYLMRETNI